ncbi:MAG: MoaD/ThiS family protein [Nakamurella sp.]
MTEVATRTVTVTVRYYAAAAAAAGREEEQIEAVVPATVRSVLDSCTDRFGPEFGDVLRRCSYLLDEVAVHDTDRALRDGAQLDVLPPFAGG